MINVLYFARVAELTGKRHEPLPLEGATTVAQWLPLLVARYPALTQAQALKVAVNKKHAQEDTPIRDQDEIAVFEPVTGG